MTVTTSAPNEYVLMVDISEYQAGADLAAHRAAGFEAISLRCQFGGVRLDRQFLTFATQAHDAGLKAMWYVWIYPGSTAAAHIALMRQAVAQLGVPELGFMLDVEDTSSTLDRFTYAALIRAVADEARQLTGKLPIIYTAAWYWDNHLGGIDEFADHPLIVASYPFQTQTGADLKAPPDHFTGYGNWAFGLGDRGQTAVPRTGGWATWQGWQFTSVAGLEIPGFAHREVRGLDANLLRPEWVAARLGAQPQPTIPTPGGADMATRIIAVEGANARFLGDVTTGERTGIELVREIEWVNGTDARQLARYQALEPHCQLMTLPMAALANVRVDRVPSGDGAHAWTGAEFGAVGPTSGLTGPPGAPGAPGRDGRDGATPAQVADEIARRLTNG